MSEHPDNFNVDFMVPGMSKCGTTTLCSMLAQHPDIFIPEVKEPLLFINENYQDAMGWYRSLFDSAPAGSLRGEGSTFYSSVTLEQGCRQRILDFNPAIKLIFIMRDPVVRIESSFRELHNSGPFYGIYPPFGLEQTLTKHTDIVADTHYWSRLCNYRDYMPKENILVILLEDLQKDRIKVLEKCFSFLGVDPAYSQRIHLEKLNSAETKLRDTRLMRMVRATPGLGPWISGLPLSEQDNIGLRFKLRTRQSGMPHWSQDCTRHVHEKIRPDMDAFLDFIGRDPSVWPRYQKMLQECR